MKFGETIQAQKEQNRDWSSFYIEYETIVNILEEYKKEQLQQLNHVDLDTLSNASIVTSASSSMFSFAGTTHNNYITTEFLISLHDQISKVVFFVLQQQGIIASDLLSCQKDIQSHMMSSDGRHPVIVGLHGTTDATESTPDSVQQLPKESTLSSFTGSANSFAELGEEEKLHVFEERYYQIGHHLLKLYQFMNINVTGIRKLLKKHDKILSQFHHTRNKLSLSMFHSIAPPSGVNSGKNQSHTVMWSPRSSGSASIFQRRRLTAEAFGNILLQPLLHDEGLTALTASLEVRLQELYSLFPLAPSQFTAPEAPSHLPPSKHNRNVSEPPLDFMWEASYGSTNAFDPRNSAARGNQRLLNAPKAPPPKGGIARLPSPGKPPMVQSARTQSRKTFLQRPSMIGHRFITTSNNLTESGTASISNMDGLLLQIQAARRRLQQTNGYTQLLAASLMTDNDGTPSEHDEDETSLLGRLELTNRLFEEGAATQMDEDETVLIPDDEELEHLKSKVRVSSILNLCSSMLYMCNYYIVAPTSASYAERLGMKASEASLIIGMTPVAALVSTVLFSWWTNHSYKSALIFASACSVLGNLCYSLGLPLNSIALVLIGRLLTGFGSARSINRRYICDTFPREERTAASASFVTASAMGMAAGPAIASILHYVTSRKDGSERFATLYWQSENAPGWFMVACWLVFLVCLVFQFMDPPKKKYEIAIKKAKSMLELTHGEMKHLLNSNDEEKESIDNGDALPPEPPIWRNIPVMTTFLIYFILKLVLEAVLSSSALVTDYYFGWDSSKVGWYLALLGLLVLPANAFVAYLAQSYDDRELIVGLQIALFFGCILMMHARNVYHLAQYILGTILLVVSANALEGPNMSLLSKTIPKSWSTGIFNVGLLSTEAGTFGRAIANVALTVFGNDGLDHLLNRTFGSFSLLTIIALYISYYFYDYLEPWDHDE
jgi:MFS-type transporter involved in bile tolerance (Atg22 family)